ARQLIDTGLASYPELSRTPDSRQKMAEHLSTVTAAQAEKDLRRAEYYERIKHPGSSYYIYQQMIQRYPNTNYVTVAEQRIARLQPLLEQSKLEPEQKDDFFDTMHKRW